MPQITKQCTKCEQHKLNTEFHARQKSLDGLSPVCKSCKAAYDLARKSPVWLAAEKSCSKCGTIKNIAEFEKCKRNRSGYGSRCKACFNAARRVINPKLRISKYLTSAERNTAKHQRRRARKNTNRVETVILRVVAERDGWICQLCKIPVDPTLSGTNRLAKSLDHIVPLSKGGDHSYDNTQLAHFGCNSSKNNRA